MEEEKIWLANRVLSYERLYEYYKQKTTKPIPFVDFCKIVSVFELHDCMEFLI